MSNKYTLVIKGECPGVFAEQDVYLIDMDGRKCFAGKVFGVMFDDALERLEQAEDRIDADPKE